MALVQRPEFLAKYPANLNGSSFIDAVLNPIKTDLGIDLTPQKPGLLTLFNAVAAQCCIGWRMTMRRIQSTTGCLSTPNTIARSCLRNMQAICCATRTLVDFFSGWVRLITVPYETATNSTRWFARSSRLPNISYDSRRSFRTTTTSARIKA